MKNLNLKLIITIAFYCSIMRIFPGSVAVVWKPEDAEYAGVLETYSGKLADVYAAVTGEGGQYWVVPSTQTSGQVKVDACCASSEDGNRPSLKVVDMNVIFTFAGKYKLIAWSDLNNYGQRCQTAGKEWTDYYTDTENHEKTHHAFDVNFVSQQIKEEAVHHDFTDMLGKCVKTQSEFDTEAQNMLDQLTPIALVTANRLINESKAADNTDTVYPYRTIDASKDCPNVPLH